MKIIKLSSSLVILYFAFAGGWPVAAQAIEESVYRVKADSTACEINSSLFDMVRNGAAPNKSKVFVIFRAGSRESETVNANRLAYVRKFLAEAKGWSNLDAIYARGDRTRGQGTIEFYIDGKLWLIVQNELNMSPCMDCCGGGPAYPQKLLRRKRQSKRHR